MGVPTSRVGDIGMGVCLAHGIPIPINVIILQGALLKNAFGQPIAQIGSQGLCSCGHMSIALQGAATVKALGIGVHRVGDMGLPPAGNYVMTQGAPTVLSGL